MLLARPFRRLAAALLLAAGTLAAPGADAQEPEAAIRAAVDARPYAATLYVGSSVADGKLRDLVFAPWSGTWGDDTLVGGSLSRRLARFWTFVMLDVEAGGLYRFGDTEGGEFWGALYLRYDGFPWTRYLYTTAGISMGFDYVTRLPVVERGTDARPEPHQSHWLNYFSPEITLALPEAPQHEAVFRYIHRSGIFGTFNGVYEGANAFMIGYRYRFRF